MDYNAGPEQCTQIAHYRRHIYNWFAITFSSCLVLSCLVLSCLALSWLGLAWLGILFHFISFSFFLSHFNYFRFDFDFPLFLPPFRRSRYQNAKRRKYSIEENWRPKKKRLQKLQKTNIWLSNHRTSKASFQNGSKKTKKKRRWKHIFFAHHVVLYSCCFYLFLLNYLFLLFLLSFREKSKLTKRERHNIWKRFVVYLLK